MTQKTDIQMKPMELRSQSDLQKAIALGYTHVMQINATKIWAYAGEPEELVNEVADGGYDDKSNKFMGCPIDEAAEWLMDKFTPLSSQEPTNTIESMEILISPLG